MSRGYRKSYTSGQDWHSWGGGFKRRTTAYTNTRTIKWVERLIMPQLRQSRKLNTHNQWGIDPLPYRELWFASHELWFSFLFKFNAFVPHCLNVRYTICASQLLVDQRYNLCILRSVRRKWKCHVVYNVITEPPLTMIENLSFFQVKSESRRN